MQQQSLGIQFHLLYNYVAFAAHTEVMAKAAPTAMMKLAVSADLVEYAEMETSEGADSYASLKQEKILEATATGSVPQGESKEVKESEKPQSTKIEVSIKVGLKDYVN